MVGINLTSGKLTVAHNKVGKTAQRWTWYSISIKTNLWEEVLMKKFIFVVLLCIFFITGCATSNKHFFKVDTTPSDALVSVHKTNDVSSALIRQIAGTTPLEKSFDFGEMEQLWLEIEKRGYVPHIEKVFPETKKVFIDLEKIKDKNGRDISKYAFPKVNRILLTTPNIKIIQRGFSSEEISQDKSKMAQEELIKGIDHFFSGKYDVITVESSNINNQLLRSLWRDVRSAMELLDPIRLKYIAEPPFLETKNSRKAARKLGHKYETEVMLFISGKQNIETAGMVAGKIGIMTAGTATSYAGGYSRALSRGDSFFVYNIHIPYFAEGTLLKAALIDCSSGEILWINKGLWGPIPFNDPKIVENIITDLLAGINQN